MTVDQMERLIGALDPHVTACGENRCTRCDRVFLLAQQLSDLGDAGSWGMVQALTGAAYRQVAKVMGAPNALIPNALIPNALIPNRAYEPDPRDDDWGGDDEYGRDWAAMNRRCW